MFGKTAIVCKNIFEKLIATLSVKKSTSKRTFITAGRFSVLFARFTSSLTGYEVRTMETCIGKRIIA